MLAVTKISSDFLTRFQFVLLLLHYGWVLVYFHDAIPFLSAAMPKIAVFKYLTFFIFAYDALNEPPHLHVVKEKGNRQRSAKIWIESLKIAEKGTLSEKDLKNALRIIKIHQTLLLESFYQIQKGLKINTIHLH